MNIIYFTLDDFDSIISYRSINTDLLREFQRQGHTIFVVSPSERRKGYRTRVINEGNAVILRPRIGNIQKTNTIEKGISTISVGFFLKKAIRKFWGDVKFDLILYCTPPITFLSPIEYIKKRDGAKTYLLLKDIFPQNAIDLGMMSKNGLKGFIYKIFRNKEKKLYAISDYIGCMSQANVDYVINHNPEVDSKKVEVCPNSVEVVDMSVDESTRTAIRNKYGIPLDKKIFVYGGNLGKPQGIDFMIECLKSQEKNDDVFFLIVGDGTEYGKIESYINNDKPSNVRLLKRLPKCDYDKMVGACDVGMIFLDHRFTIPNFPSRLLSYMQAKIPVLAVTDPNTDIGKVIVEGGFGWWCESNEVKEFKNVINQINLDCVKKQEKEFDYLNDKYSSSVTYKIIMKSYEKEYKR